MTNENAATTDITIIVDGMVIVTPKNDSFKGYGIIYFSVTIKLTKKYVCSFLGEGIFSLWSVLGVCINIKRKKCNTHMYG